MKIARHFVAYSRAIVVIALTNVGFGLAIVGFAWTILGCAPGAIHVAPADSTAFQRMMDAEVVSDARRPAHLMGQTVSGRSSDKAREMDNDKLPEGYMREEYRHLWPSQFHLAYAARRLIRAHYAATHPTYQVLEDDELVEVVDEAGGNLGLVLPFEEKRPLDIADIQERRLFEIVPPGQGERSWGNNKVDWIRDVVNKAMLGVPPFELGTNYEGEVGVRFAEGAPAWSLTFKTVDPGVVQYEWHVLSPSDASEEAHRTAYLDNQWHDPTPYEMVRFARALHEVVERLVQAREELGQTHADTTIPILPGKTRVDYLRSLARWSAHDDKVARLLPVMRKPPPAPPPAQVRHDARHVGQTLGGGGGGDPPGGYTVKGRPGNQPINLHMGNAAHNVIGTQYKTQHPGHDVRINTVSIQKIVEDAGGDTRLVRPDEALKRPDITDLKDRVVFEIKSSAEGQLEEAKAKVAKDITAINRAMPLNKQFKHGTGFYGDFWVRFTLDMRWWRLKWSTTAPGVIQYTWSKLNDDEVDEDEIRKGIQDGRFTWVNLTEADMQQYAERCERFSQMYAVGAAKLHTIQMVTDFVVGIIGDAAIVYLSPGLAPGKTVQKAAQPGTRIPADPQVNAPSLGNDGAATFTGPVHSTPRPAVPRKTPSGPTNVSPN